MSKIVKEVSDSLRLADLIKLLNKNTHSERDNPDKEVYINHIINNVYRNKHHRITLLYDNNIPIGYLIIRLDNYLMNEIIVYDVFIIKECQGEKNIRMLIDECAPIMISSGAKRVKWQSYIFDEEFWKDHTFGTEVKSYKMFYINLDNDAQDIYEKTREEEA